MRTSRANYAKAARAGAAALSGHPRGATASELLRSLALHFEQEPKRASAKSPMTEWASMKDEIARKALQALQDAMTKHEAGIITGRELWLVADTLFDTTHGLIDQEPSAVLYRIRQELKEHAPA